MTNKLKLASKNTQADNLNDNLFKSMITSIDCKRF